MGNTFIWAGISGYLPASRHRQSAPAIRHRVISFSAFWQPGSYCKRSMHCN